MFSLYCQANGDPEKYEWYKDGKPLSIDGLRIIWEHPNASGNIRFLDPKESDQGYYQCYASNSIGTAVSNKMQLSLGFLDLYVDMKDEVYVVPEGSKLSVACRAPFGKPRPQIVWVYRKRSDGKFMKSISDPHITVDDYGNLLFSYVSAMDAAPDLIYQCGAYSPVLQDGLRFGNFITISLDQNQTTTDTKPSIMYASPAKISVKVGSELKLMCIFGGRPLPVVRWSKLHDDLPLSRINNLSTAESAFGKMLIIKKSQREDAGIYECHSEGIVHQMLVTIKAPPYWLTEQPKQVFVPEEDTINMRCMAVGYPEPVFTWLRNGKPIHGYKRIHVLSGGALLQIQNANYHDDSGIYQCNASNINGYIFRNIFLKVLAHAPYFEMNSNVTMDVIKNSTVYMPCEFKAAPKAVARWVDRENRYIHTTSGRVQIFENNTLRIVGTKPVDEGLYYCNVSNKYGIDRATYRLSVYTATQFLEVPRLSESEQVAHQSFVLNCAAVGDPRLKLTYTWKRNGRRINDSDTFRVNGSKLIVNDVRGWHSGHIQCIASSGVDEIKADLNMSIIDVPATPEIQLLQCSDEQAVVAWSKPEDYGDRIYEFILQQQIAFKEGHWKTVKRLSVDDNVIDNMYSVTIPLSPWAEYKFRVIACNKHGQSKPGYADGQCSTPSTNPTTNPENVSAEGDEPNNLVIKWKAMEKIDWNGPNLEYIVKFRQDNNNSVWRQIIIQDPLAESTTVRDQPTYSRYLVQVKARNDIGDSIAKPKIIVGYSGENYPTESPMDFKVITQANWTCTTVGWRPVDPKTVRGFFKGYLIEYWLDEFPLERYKIYVDKSTSVTQLTNLHPVSNYTAQIVTINKRYQSSVPSILHFATAEGLPSKVHNMRIRAVGANTVFASWEECRQPNGVILGYFIQFIDNENKIFEETFVLNRQLYYLYEKARPNAQYTVSVWGKTYAGEGAKVTRSVKTWPTRKPDVPNFEVRVLTSYQAEVIWHPFNRSKWLMPGSSFYVNYSKQGDEGWVKSRTAKLPEKVVLLRNLSEGTEYVLIGVAEEQNRLSFSQPIIIRTPSDGFLTRILQGHMHGTAWFISTMCVLLIATFTVMIMCCCQRQHSGKYPVKRKEMEKGCFQPDSDEHKNFMEYQYGFSS